eukprot:CAMPEP_0194776780 /NCGR_PEP_ID=MMETSP0323_2-20130528/63974_1 /TAXON_ID=2866 ORGANISM="Crypthecodinium cohnii, Strain Seligo" /NCGR_SAMPLE_ID=MMETSP0323_2 /ASSEMBLY_ACC=CAM_ASM_000346 /LENGTH=178 /DNA_ID=CAMNT_0039713325 /DNA_START=33 /DNA_END=567 /DNA_ORIENTATION=+
MSTPSETMAKPNAVPNSAMAADAAPTPKVPADGMPTPKNGLASLAASAKVPRPQNPLSAATAFGRPVPKNSGAAPGQVTAMASAEPKAKSRPQPEMQFQQSKDYWGDDEAGKAREKAREKARGKVGGMTHGASPGRLGEVANINWICAPLEVFVAADLRSLRLTPIGYLISRAVTSSC